MPITVSMDPKTAEKPATPPIPDVAPPDQFDYDLIAIGSGPGGQKAVMQAAKLGKRAAIVDVNELVGGVCLHTGTIPSKSFREAIVHLSGVRERSHYGKAYRVKEIIEMTDLVSRCGGIVRDIEQTIRAQFIRNKADILCGYGSIVDRYHVKVKNGNRETTYSTRVIVLATGTRPWHPPGFDFDGKVILDSDTVLSMKEMPKNMVVVGGGVIGCEYGSMFATLGVKVTIVEARETILNFLDRELIDSLVHTLRNQKATVLTNEKVIRCAKAPDGRAVTFLESGKRLVSGTLLVSAGRLGNIEGLNLPEVGVKVEARGKVAVNEHFQTSVDNIYAVGDLIGFPSLASTSLEQGRRAACHAFGLHDRVLNLPLPYGIYAIPEIGMVGKTEAELTKEKIPYETGIGRFSEVERGRINGDDVGLLKLLFSPFDSTSTRCTRNR
jgi:NAD(P) transhydrogenase